MTYSPWTEIAKSMVIQPHLPTVRIVDNDPDGIEADAARVAMLNEAICFGWKYDQVCITEYLGYFVDGVFTKTSETDAGYVLLEATAVE